jgi:hypothetical protein
MPSCIRELESEARFGEFPSAEVSRGYPIGSTWSGFHKSWFQCQTEQSMKRHPNFSRSYFEREFPHIQRLTDYCGETSSVLLTLDERFRIELREYQLCPSGLDDLWTLSNSFPNIRYPGHLRRNFGRNLHITRHSLVHRKACDLADKISRHRRHLCPSPSDSYLSLYLFQCLKYQETNWRR